MKFVTLNRYYFETDLDNFITTLIDIDGNKLYFDKTMFYAESGGQESDLGTIKSLNKNIEFNIIDVQYEKSDVFCRTAHFVETELELSKIFEIGESFILTINKDRRENLSAYHTASHLMFIAAEKVRSGITKNVIGCHIKEDSARFDFRTENKFEENELLLIEKDINDMISASLPIQTYFSDESLNERVWECNDHKIPCGGTHLDNTSLLGTLKVKRKGIGKGKERLICYCESGILS